MRRPFQVFWHRRVDEDAPVRGQQPRSSRPRRVRDSSSSHKVSPLERSWRLSHHRPAHLGGGVCPRALSPIQTQSKVRRMWTTFAPAHQDSRQSIIPEHCDRAIAPIYRRHLDLLGPATPVPTARDSAAAGRHGGRRALDAGARGKRRASSSTAGATTVRHSDDRAIRENPG